MDINGLSGLLSSQSTRDVKLSCGFSFTCRKLRVKDRVQKEEHIISKRGSVKHKTSEVIEAIQESSGQEDVKTALLEGLKLAIVQIATRDSYAYYDEMSNFSLSDHGRAYDLHLATEKKVSVEEFLFLMDSNLSKEDSEELDDVWYWIKEIDLLKKPDTPQEDGELKETKITSDGES